MTIVQCLQGNEEFAQDTFSEGFRVKISADPIFYAVLFSVMSVSFTYRESQILRMGTENPLTVHEHGINSERAIHSGYKLGPNYFKNETITKEDCYELLNS